MALTSVTGCKLPHTTHIIPYRFSYGTIANGENKYLSVENTLFR